jgi:glycosyltransferase involved in cell wall biosynthesis
MQSSNREFDPKKNNGMEPIKSCLNRSTSDAIKPGEINSTTMQGTTSIIVAIPAFNEEIAIAGVVLRSLKYVDKVIVINDGSRDKTKEVAELAGAEVLEHNKNIGKGTAIKDAFDYAKNVNADILVTIDGDGQHNPDEIPLVLGPILKGQADIVNGSRFLNKNGHIVPRYRQIGQEILTIATNIGMNACITDSQNGFRAFSKKTFNAFSFKQYGMAIESEMLIEASDAYLRITEVPINVRYNVEGSTYNPVAHGITVLWKLILLISQRKLFLVFCLAGIIFLSIGSVFAVLTNDIFNNAYNIMIIYIMLCVLYILLGISITFTGLILALARKIKSK